MTEAQRHQILLEMLAQLGFVTVEKVVERPVSPCDLIGSIYSRLGIPSDAVLRTPQGETVGLLEDNEGDMKGDGILREIGC